MEQKWSPQLFENYGRLALMYSLSAVTKDEAKAKIKQYAANDREYNEAVAKIDTLWI
jgi:hypothetical protein